MPHYDHNGSNGGGTGGETPPEEDSLGDEVAALTTRVENLEAAVASLNARMHTHETGGTTNPVTPVTVTYSESTDFFLRTGCGAYKLYVYPRDGTSFANHAAEAASLRTSDRLNVIVLVFNLNDYRGTDTIDSNFITDTVAASFTSIRANNFMCIVRVVYDYVGNGSASDPAPSRVLTHINQLASTFNSNKDVILFYQSGMLGSYGEWFESANHGNDNWPIEDNGGGLKLAMVQRQLEQWTDRPIAIRYPRHLRWFLNDESTVDDATPQPSSPRITGTGNADRLTEHDDSFLANPTNGGTYHFNGEDERGDKAWQIARMAAKNLFISVEQEDFGDQGQGAKDLRESRWSEFEDRRVISFSEDYTAATMDWWATEVNPDTGRTYRQDMDRYAGYRLVLVRGSFPTSVVNTDNYVFSLTWKNVGWTTTHKAFTPKVKFGSQAVVTATADKTSKAVLPGGAEVTITYTVNTPATTGSQALKFEYDDPDSLTDVAYNLRPANVGIYDTGTGLVDLQHSVTVT